MQFKSFYDILLVHIFRSFYPFTTNIGICKIYICYNFLCKNKILIRLVLVSDRQMLWDFHFQEFVHRENRARHKKKHPLKHKERAREGGGGQV